MENKDTNCYLDNRLKTVASFVRKNSICADIGCDHGKLSVYLCKSGHCKHVYACDVNITPLEKAKKALLAAGCKNATCILANGLSALNKYKINDVVIAGLSGVTIAKIIEDAPTFHKEEYRFIFAPASKPDYLRQYLCQNGFEILSEKAVLCANRVYSVMHIGYSGKKTTQSELFYAVGKIKGNTSAEKAYEKKLLNHLNKQGNTQLIKEVKQWFSQEI